MNRKGLILIELLLVLTILAVLLAFVAGVAQRARHTALRLSCANQLRQLGLAAQMYQDTFGRPAPHPSACMPFLEGHKAACPLVEIGSGYTWSPGKKKLAEDDEPRHLGMHNVLFSDGHVEVSKTP